MLNPLVSVIAGCYNHEKWVKICLDGIRCQTYPNIQLIIVDDFSTDDSVNQILEWIRVYQVECIFIQNASNLGVCKTLNKAIELCTGEYIACTSTDDLWDIDHIQSRIDVFMNSSSDTALVYGDVKCISECGGLTGQLGSTFLLFPDNIRESSLDKILTENFIWPVSVLFRKAHLIEIGKFDENLRYEDWDMYIRILKKFKCVYLNRNTSYYRLVSNSLSRRDHSGYINEATLQLIYKHLTEGAWTKNQIRLMLKNYEKFSVYLFSINYPRFRKYLWKNFIISRSVRSLFIYSLSYLFSYKFLSSFYKRNIFRFWFIRDN